MTAENYEVYWLPTPNSALETGHKVRLKELVSRAKAERIADMFNRETKGALGVYVSVEKHDKTLAQEIKELGWKSVKEFCAVVDVSERTLLNWKKTKPKLFKTILKGSKSV